MSGADEDGKPWVVKANVACPGYQGIDAPQLLVDFTPKGGPKDVTATFSTTSDLKYDGKLTFPDGNVWSMVRGAFHYLQGSLPSSVSEFP